jgi:DNA-binding response OmpR family regulator
MKAHVLVVSANRELLSLRVAVLKAAGFAADMAESHQQILELLSERNYEAMVVCWSISDVPARDYANLFRQRNPQGCLVYVGKSSWTRPKTIQADRVVSGAEGPDTLIEALNCREAPQR